MTDKMARDESDERHKGSIVERAARRVSSDLSADIAREDSLRTNGAADAAAMPSGGIRRPTAPVEEETLGEPFPDLGSADIPLVSTPGPEPEPESEPGPETPGGNRPAAGPDTATADAATADGATADGATAGGATADGADPAGASFNLNFSRLSAAGFITPDTARNRMTEEYRLIKRTLLNRHWNGSGPRGNMILVTSALMNEGKTFTAINLAISMAAEENLSVLLIDADFNNGGAMSVLGCHDKIGLIDVLDNPDMKLDDVLLQTNIPNLSIVPAGRFHERSTELLAGPRMAQLTEELVRRYENRFIIFDCPPLLVTTEAAALTAHVGQVLFVVRAESTKEVAVRHALEMIDEKPEVGLILNRTRTRIGGSEFGDYGNYYYGYYGNGGKGSESAPPIKAAKALYAAHSRTGKSLWETTRKLSGMVSHHEGRLWGRRRRKKSSIARAQRPQLS